MGIGGEYAAINSAIDELIPSKYRGRVDISVNGTYWAGALIGSAVTQAFLYNAIFFTHALVLKSYFGLSDSGVVLYFFPFAIGNLAGPLLLGHFFDTIGRRKMILATYSIAAVTLFITALLFNSGALNAAGLTAMWCLVFFFASAGASSAYLTVSEIFPIELRGQAISFFFAISQLTGGLIAWFFGVDAEGQSLENVAKPLSATGRAGATRFQGTAPRLPSTDAQGRRITPVVPESDQPEPDDPS